MGYYGEFSYNLAYDDGYAQGSFTTATWMISLIKDYIKDESMINGEHLLYYIQDKIRNESKT